MTEDNNQQQEYERMEAEAAEARRRELEAEELEARRMEELANYDSTPTESWEDVRLANQLAIQQSARQESQGADGFPLFSGPSLFKYAIILLLFAVPNDMIDALEFTGLGVFFSWFISAFLSITTILISWFSDSEFQRVKSHMANRAKYEQALTKTATKVAAKVAKFAPKNPLVKIIAGSVLELIPIISVLPWSSISVFLAYADERKTIKEAREAMGSDQELDMSSEPSPEMV